MMYTPALLAVASLFIQHAVSESEFIQPPPAGDPNDFSDNAVYQDGDTLKVQWKTDLNITSVRLFQHYPVATNGKNLVLFASME